MDRKKVSTTFPAVAGYNPTNIIINSHILIMIPQQKLYALAVRCFGQDSLYSRVVLAIYALVGRQAGRQVATLVVLPESISREDSLVVLVFYYYYYLSIPKKKRSIYFNQPSMSWVLGKVSSSLIFRMRRESPLILSKKKKKKT